MTRDCADALYACRQPRKIRVLLFYTNRRLMNPSFAFAFRGKVDSWLGAFYNAIFLAFFLFAVGALAFSSCVPIIIKNGML